MTLSALIIARNEESKIEKTLRSLNFVDEIVLILDRSTDNTKSKSERYTKNIYSGSWKSEGKRRNYGLSKCNSEWILEIDADEVIGKKLSKEIIEKIKIKDADFYYIPLVNYIGEKKVIYGWMACLAPDGKFCLFKRNCKNWLDGNVHPEYRLKGEKGIAFVNAIDHYMSRNLSDLVLRFNRNSSLYALDIKEKNKSIKKLISKRKIFSRFIKSFFSRRGYKSGSIGLLIAIFCSIYPYVSAIKSKHKIINF